jgi:hypothetical protein
VPRQREHADRAEQHGTEQVCRNEEGTPTDPVHDDAGEHAEKEVGQPLRGPHDPEGCLVGVQRLDEEQLQGEGRDEGAEVRDGVGDPVTDEHPRTGPFDHQPSHASPLLT